MELITIVPIEITLKITKVSVTKFYGSVIISSYLLCELLKHKRDETYLILNGASGAINTTVKLFGKTITFNTEDGTYSFPVVISNIGLDDYMAFRFTRHTVTLYLRTGEDWRPICSNSYTRSNYNVRFKLK